jgi:hypothetical protein
MLDLFNTPTPTNADVQIFTASCNGTNFIGWQTWKKPRGVTFVHMVGIGCGGGGGAGAPAGAINASFGGGGGGSGGLFTGFFAAADLPDILYIQVSAGGIGGSGGAGSYGANTIIAYAAINNSTYWFVQLTSGSPGDVGASSFQGVGGSGGAVGATQGPSALSLAMNGMATTTDQCLVGQTGVGGGTTAGSAGTNLTLPTNGIVTTGGCGGASLGAAASTGFAGGSIPGPT